MNNQIKLIALDMDNTLLNGQKKLSSRNEAILKKLRKQGIYIVLTTGRPFAGIRPFVKQLDLVNAGDYSVNFNGAVVYENQSEEIVFEKYLTLDQIKSMKLFADKMQVPMDCITGSCVYSVIDNKKSTYENYVGKLNTFYDVTFAQLPENEKYYKFVIEEAVEKIEEIEELLPEFEDMTVLKSRRDLLEFAPKGINKTVGLSHLLEKLNLTWDNVMAFGDEENDLEMIQSAQMGIAMGNAVELIKNAANDVTSSNIDDGVAKYLEKYFKLD